jgi:hypothetical protein
MSGPLILRGYRLSFPQCFAKPTSPAQSLITLSHQEVFRMSHDPALSQSDFTAPPIVLNPNTVRSVGFLRRGEPFAVGDVDAEVFRRLCELTQNPFQPWVCGGVRRCDLCRFTGNSIGTFKRNPKDMPLQVSATSSTVDLWIPGEGLLYKCPTSVTHYIDAHGFCPPPEFCAAVLSCPPMRSVAYFKAILANGGREIGFARALHNAEKINRNPRPDKPGF